MKKISSSAVSKVMFFESDLENKGERGVVHTQLVECSDSKEEVRGMFKTSSGR
jgi:hypothetical protein